MTFPCRADTFQSRRPQLTRFGAAHLVLALVLGAGCQSGPVMFPVEGNVTVDGEPMAAGSVALYPDGSRGHASLEVSGGQVRNGRYEILTGQRHGAPPGAYRVVVISTNFSGDNPPPKGPTAEMPRSLIDLKYSHPSQTPLTLEVVSKPADGAYDLAVTLPPRPR